MKARYRGIDQTEEPIQALPEIRPQTLRRQRRESTPSRLATRRAGERRRSGGAWWNRYEDAAGERRTLEEVADIGKAGTDALIIGGEEGKSKSNLEDWSESEEEDVLVGEALDSMRERLLRGIVVPRAPLTCVVVAAGDGATGAKRLNDAFHLFRRHVPLGDGVPCVPLAPS